MKKLFKNYSDEQLLNICWVRNCKDNTPKPVTVAKFNELLNCPETISLIEQLAASPHNDAYKKDLHAFCFCADSFENNHRSKGEAHANGLGIIDIDEMAITPEELYQQLGGEFTMRTNGIVLFHKSPSADGVHIIFRLQPGEDIETGQERLCRNLGITLKIDPQVKDASRISFVVTSDYIFYIDEEAFIPGQMTDCIAPQPTLALVKAEPADKEYIVEDAEIIEEITEDEVANRYEGIPLKIIADQVLTELLMMKGTPCEADHNRHTYYTKLAGYMSHVCDHDPALVLKTLPSWGLPEDECRQICKDFCRDNASKPMPRALRRLIDSIKTKQDIAEGRIATSHSRYLAPMPTNLPRFFQTYLKMFPEEIRTQAFVSSFAWLGTLTTALRYTHNTYEVNATNFLVYVVGHMASGKGFTRTADRILADVLHREDDVAIAQIREWKDISEAAGNRRRPRRPHPVFRCAESDFTEPALINLIIDSKQQHVLITSEESNDFTINRKVASILCKSFDNASVGQTRVSAQSVSGKAPAYLNVCLCGTPRALHNLIADAENGLASRFMIVKMPATLGQNDPVWTPLTDRDKALIESEVLRLHQIGLVESHQAVEQLDDQENLVSVDLMQNTHHEVWIDKMPKIEAAIKGFKEKIRLEYNVAQDIAPNIFSHRIPTIIRRVAMVMWALEGGKETRRGVEAAMWVGEYVLQNFLNLYGSDYDQTYRDDLAQSREYQRRGHNQDFFDHLPNDFTFTQLAEFRQKQGLSCGYHTLHSYISRKKKEGLLVADAVIPNLYHKIAC